METQLNERILSYGAQIRIDCASGPLRQLLADMRSDSAARPQSEYLRGYCAGLALALSTLGI
jgi:hypothetical protein